MLIKPQQKHRDKLFYNNILLILTIFSVICFWTATQIASTKSYEGIVCDGKIMPQSLSEPYEGTILGPINVNNKIKMFKIKADYYGNNSSTYLIGEVLDENKETLYEFGKDMWHESGYDSDGYYSEGITNMITYLTLKEKGNYYIQFSQEPDYSVTSLEDILKEQNTNTTKKMENIHITIEPVKKSYVPHVKAGSLILLLVIILFCFLNWGWVKATNVKINEMIEEMSDD